MKKSSAHTFLILHTCHASWCLYHWHVILIYAVFNKVLGNNGSSSGFKLLDDISKCSLKWNVYWFSLVLPKDIQRNQKTRSNWYFYCFLFLFFSLARTSIIMFFHERAIHVTCRIHV